MIGILTSDTICLGRNLLALDLSLNLPILTIDRLWNHLSLKF